MSEWKCSYKACECSSDAEKSECDLAYKTKKMKRYQVKRWDKRNTLRALKFTFPLWFMMNVMTVILIYTMIKIN